MMEIPSTGSLAIKDPAVTVIYGLAGWALCGATMGMAMKAATLETALIVHAVAAPCIFTGLSLHYFHRSTAWSPIQAAATFLCVVILMDVLVVALLIERSFGMFGSLLGTWAPFLLIFISTWWTGLAVHRFAHPAS